MPSAVSLASCAQATRCPSAPSGPPPSSALLSPKARTSSATTRTTSPRSAGDFFDAYRKSLALWILQAYRRLIEVPHPAAKAGEPGRTDAPSAADTATNTAPAPVSAPAGDSPAAAVHAAPAANPRATTTAIADAARNTGTRRVTGGRIGRC